MDAGASAAWIYDGCMKTSCALWAVLLALAPACMGATRKYYIAAEEVTWDYAPSGRDLIHGRSIPAPWLGQTRWGKTRYIEYTDATFSVRKPQAEWLGILGPIIRAEVGDTILVEFRNRSRFPHSMHPHGLRYDKANEGSMYLPSGRGGSVPPGGHFSYTWLADEGSGPGPGDANSVVWWYHAHMDEAKETNAGLLGPIIITAKGESKPDGTPKGVDSEFVAMFMVFDELKGKDAGLFHAINGYIFGNLPGMIVKGGARVRWYLLAMGNERDLHSPHWHGKTVQYGSRHTDVVELLPGSMTSVDMIADNPGTWLLHCHVADHMEAGMMATYTIYQPQTEPCPLKVVSGDFWNTSGKFTVRVKNVSGNAIRSFFLRSATFLSPQDLRPAAVDWSSLKPIPPGEEQILERNNYLHNSAAIFGWALFPFSIAYEDGSQWKARETGDCFEAFWRDKDHPDLVVLPPLQMEMNAD
jgi:manganese oxidase